MRAAPVAVEVYRGDTLESVHRVHVAVVDGQGNLVASVGDPDLVTYARSSVKPFQAVPLVREGVVEAFGLTDREIAVACGSHAGEPMHVETVAGMLAKAGLSPDLLRCGAHPVRNKHAREALKGAKPTSLHHNCSGKHAGMLLLQKHLGGDPAHYLHPGSPAQRAVLAAMAEVAGVPESSIATGTDGCSAPNFALPLRTVARMFANLAMPGAHLSKETAAALERVARAMTRHPEMVAGTDEFDSDLMGASEDRLATKVGAEAVQGVADLGSGMGLFLKVEDGSHRATTPATVEALRQLGWLEPRAFEVLGEWWMPRLTNAAGLLVGHVKPVLVLEGLQPAFRLAH